MRVTAVFLACLPLLTAAQPLRVSDMRYGTTYTGACDASAAAAVGDSTFIIGSDEADEDFGYRLHLYRRNASAPVASIDLAPAVEHPSLKREPDDDVEDRETDIEGAARVGNRIYWLASHGRSRKAKQRLHRHRFFATDVVGETVVLPGTPVRPAYSGLFNVLLADDRLASLKLSTLDNLAPEAGGFNIEGLAATETASLLIGLRSPLDPQGRAVLIPLEAADDLITGKAQKAQLGDPLFLDLDRRGIRDITFWRERKLYLILAGPVDDAPRFALYAWSPGVPPALLIDSAGFAGFSPETMVLTTATRELLILSDDGDEAVTRDSAGKVTKANKDAETASRTFRSLSVVLQSGVR